MALATCGVTTNANQKEMKSHGSVDFPIACYADEPTEAAIPWHWHEEMEYAFVTEGEPVFLLENTRIQLHPGEGIFINTGALHAVENLKSPASGLHSAVFHYRLAGGSTDSRFWQQFVQPLLHSSALRYILLTPNVPWQNQILKDFRQCWESISSDMENYENSVRFWLTDALWLITKHCPGISHTLSEQEQLDASRIRTMLEYIEAHYAEDLSVEQIAGSISVSGSVCLRCFNQMLGITPIQYVRQLRLGKAAQLLRNSSKTAKEIALECGFNDISYFTRTFRQKMGCTPKEYRNQAL